MTTSIAPSGAFNLFDVISEDISKDVHDVNYAWIASIDGNKVRIRIRSNPYSFQCWATGEVWSKTDLRWNEVATIPHGAMQTPDSLVYKPNGTSKHWFAADKQSLCQMIASILL